MPLDYSPLIQDFLFSDPTDIWARALHALHLRTIPRRFGPLPNGPNLSPHLFLPSFYFPYQQLYIITLTFPSIIVVL
jgi:hypothetical protein